MKASELVIGKKYVPHAKTATHYGDLKDSVVWRAATKKGQPYLFYTGPSDNGFHSFDSEFNGKKPSGDFFNPEDVTEYDEDIKTGVLEVDKGFVMEAYDAANGEWKRNLKSKFPKLFKPEAFEFGISCELKTNARDLEGPIYIGNNHAPDGLEFKCLIVNPVYDLQVIEGAHGKVLKFTEKQPAVEKREFKIGDHVIGNSKASRYGITIEGWRGRVVAIGDNNTFSANGPNSRGVAENFSELRRECFDLAEGPLTVEKEFVLAAHKYACKDWKEKLENKFPELFEETYSVGNRFSSAGTEYIMAKAGAKTVTLINVKTGYPWSVESLNVKDCKRITKSEFKKLVNYKELEFKKIGK